MTTLNLTLKVWRQDGPDDAGRFETIDAPDVLDDMSFLEMLDIVNERLTNEGRSRSPSTTTAGRASAAPARS